MPTSTALTFRTATPDDVEPLVALVRTAYRGDVGWTTESALLADERIDATGVAAKVGASGGVVLVAEAGPSGLVGCCELVRRAGGVAYFGMFAVEPALQASGVGRQVLAHAESYAAREWEVSVMEMTVIAQRTELIEWYQRRGYVVTDETRPFPYDQLVGGPALRDDLYFVVLTKPLQG